MFRFLLTRRWLGLLLAVTLVGVACVELGLWQFRRFHERSDSNASIRSHLAESAVPVDEVMSTTSAVSESDEWTNVVATGRYDVAHQVLVLYRTRQGSVGVDVVVPLVTASGTALVVDRGWVQTAGNGNERPDVPAPPTGQVTVTGWVRRSSTGDSGQVSPSDGFVRAISSDAIGTTVPYAVFDGFLDATKEDPVVTPAPAPAEAPDLSSGPSFFYGLQWFFFAVLAFGFWAYFAWSEYRESQAPPRIGMKITVPE